MLSITQAMEQSGDGGQQPQSQQQRLVAQLTQQNILLRDQLCDAKRDTEQAKTKYDELRSTLKATRLEELELEVGC